MLELLLIIFLILIFVTYVLFDYDVMAPPFLFCSMYFFSILCAFLNRVRWGIELSNEAFYIYLLGAIIFIGVGLLCKVALTNKRDVTEKTIIKRININPVITILLTIVCMITLYLWIKNVKDIAGPSTSFSNMMEKYRGKTSYSFEEAMPGYVQQLSKIVLASAYIYGFTIVNNCMAKNMKKVDLLNIIPILLYILLSLYDSNRLNLLQLIATIAIYFGILWNLKNSTANGSIKFIFKLMLVFFLVLISFYGIRLVVGRTISKNINFIDYITVYAGGPVKLFDMFVRDPVHHTDLWGKETFISLYNSLRKFDPDIPKYLVHKEFRMYNGIDLGNVYSAYREWYADFGMSGVVILQIIFATFFNTFYFKLKSIGAYNKKFLLIIYGYMASAILLHPIDDKFFTTAVSMGFIIILIVFYVIYNLTLKKYKIIW